MVHNNCATLSSLPPVAVMKPFQDDNIVDFDKIGSGNYYWAFPSKNLQKRKRALKDLESELEVSEAKKNKLAQSVDQARVGREESARLGLASLRPAVWMYSKGRLGFVFGKASLCSVATSAAFLKSCGKRTIQSCNCT